MQVRWGCGTNCPLTLSPRISRDWFKIFSPSSSFLVASVYSYQCCNFWLDLGGATCVLQVFGAHSTKKGHLERSIRVCRNIPILQLFYRIIRSSTAETQPSCWWCRCCCHHLCKLSCLTSSITTDITYTLRCLMNSKSPRSITFHRHIVGAPPFDVAPADASLAKVDLSWFCEGANGCVSTGGPISVCS